MEIILRETIDNLGRAGEVIKVADGYARNYLLPRKLAYPATAGNLKVIEFERQSLLRKEAKQKDDAEKLQKMLEQVEIMIRRKVGEQNALYGSVTNSMLPTNSRKRVFRSRSARSTWTITSRHWASFPSRSVCSKTSQRMSN
jgi:large subunit ribosomal protein L9